ncbi:hypothetical protein D3C73_1334170 [compost metagenome]
MELQVGRRIHVRTCSVDRKIFKIASISGGIHRTDFEDVRGTTGQVHHPVTDIGIRAVDICEPFVATEELMPGYSDVIGRCLPVQNG